MDIQYSESDAQFMHLFLEDFELNFEEQSDSTWTSNAFPQDDSTNTSDSGSLIATKKSSKRKIGSKIVNNYLIPNYNKRQPRKKGLTVQQALAEGGLMPNMSRRAPTNVLMVFPSFDKCDSLLYFASSLTRHLNSADVKSAENLVNAHQHKDCVVNFCMGHDLMLPAQAMTQMLYLFEDLEPDRIMCVHSTKVVENKIKSTIYMKLTDCQPLYSYKTKELKESVLGSMCMEDRINRLSLYSHIDSSTDAAREQIQALSNTNDDLLMYLAGEMVLTVDDVSNKITHIHFTVKLTSVHTIL